MNASFSWIPNDHLLAIHDGVLLFACCLAKVSHDSPFSRTEF